MLRQTVILLSLMALSACRSQDGMREIPKDIVTACATVAACGGRDTGNCLQVASESLIYTDGLHRALPSCLVSATTCEEARACMVFFEYCLPDGGGNFVCLNGTECLEGVSGKRWCGVGRCSETSRFMWCEEDVEVTCRDGIETRRDCTRIASDVECRDGHCWGEGERCGHAHCDGEQVRFCLMDRLSGPRKCPTAFFDPICTPAVDGYPDGEGTCLERVGPECDPHAMRDQCDGDDLLICDGEIRRIPCKPRFRTCGEVDGVAACRW